MAGIADARDAVKNLFDKLSGADDAEARVDDIEQLAGLKTMLDEIEETVTATPAEVPAGELVGAGAVGAVTAGLSALGFGAPLQVPAFPERGHKLTYKVDVDEGEKRPASKEALGKRISETFSALKKSGRPGQTVPIFSYKATGVDYDETGTVDTEVADKRAASVLAACGERIISLAGMTPAQAALSHVKAGVGTCAVPSPRMEFCNVDALAGILDLASFSMPPAGVRLPSEPNVMPVYDNLLCLTEADEIAREDPKPCWTIDCISWNDVEPCLVPLCIEVGTLTRWAFPQLVDKVLAEALKKYEQWLNAANLRAIANSPGTILLDFTGMVKTGAINDIVSAVLIAASQFRTKWRLDDNYPLRLVAESFVWDVLASDGNRRATSVEMLGLARAVIETTLAKHSIEVVSVYDFQDAQATGDPAGWGGQSYVTSWPATADLLLFAPDSWQEYREELIRVQGLRQESTLLRDNRELALFVESAHATVQRCKETLRIRVPLCPAGTHQLQDWDGATCPI
jgi:hypothetical protein